MGILMHQLYSLKASFFTQWSIAESPHVFMSIVLRLAAGLELSSLEINWQLSFFPTNKCFWQHFKFKSCEGGKGSSKGKEARSCVFGTASSLRSCAWCCHFLCKAPQQPKGSVGRLLLGGNQLVSYFTWSIILPFITGSTVDCCPNILCTSQSVQVVSGQAGGRSLKRQLLKSKDISDFVTFIKILTSSSIIIQCCKCHAKMQSHNPMSPSLAPLHLPNAVIAMCTMLSYGLPWPAREKTCSKTREWNECAQQLWETLPRPPLGGASFTPFGDAVLYLGAWFYCVYWKALGPAILSKSTQFVRTVCEASFKKWNFQDCHIITGSATADFACHPILSLPSIITVPWHRTLRLPRNVTLPCDFLSFPSFCFCPVLSRVPFPSWLCYFSFLSLFLPLSFCYCSLWFSWFLKSQ